VPLQIAGLIHLELLTDFFNKIGQSRHSRDFQRRLLCPQSRPS
jgi:hypothetical protein